MNDPSQELVQRALGGDATAFDELVRLHRPGLVRFIDMLIWDADEAESLAQESFLRALAQLHDFKIELRFSAWLQGIALNLCRNHRRNAARHAQVVAPGTLQEAPDAKGRGRGVLSGILRREMSGHVDRAIQLLPEGLREAFVLHTIEELSYDEIGQVLEVSAGTARVRAHRARLLLRESLGPIVDTWYRDQRPAHPRAVVEDVPSLEVVSAVKS